MGDRGRPRLLDSAIRRLYGRNGVVTVVESIAPGFRELRIRAASPSGGWQPGHEIELRIQDDVVRHYTVHRVDSADEIRVLADLHAGGPGSRWLAETGVGRDVEIAASPHKRRWPSEHRLLALGDGSAVGLLAAGQLNRPGSTTSVAEVPPGAIDRLRDWNHHIEFIPASPTPGESLRSWVDMHGCAAVLADAALLAGHAQTLQLLRTQLISIGQLSRRSIETRAYWSTGKAGL